MKYYDIGPLNRKRRDHNLIISGRGPGKSFQICKLILEDYEKTGHQWVRVVRDITYLRTLSNWFDEKVTEEFKQRTGLNVEYADTSEGCHFIVYKDGDRKHYDILCYVLVLTQEQKYKSNRYPNVYNIVMEEFALMNGDMYLPDEADLFLSLLSTIVRDREGVRCWYIGNTLTKVCPYFDMLNIDIDKLNIKAGEIRDVPQPTTFFRAPATVAIEYPELSFEVEDEIPRCLRLMHNECATTGEFRRAPDIFDFDEEICKNKNILVVFRAIDYDIRVYRFRGTRDSVYFYRCPRREKKVVPIEFNSLKERIEYNGEDFNKYFEVWKETQPNFFYSDDAVKRTIKTVGRFR